MRSNEKKPTHSLAYRRQTSNRPLLRQTNASRRSPGSVDCPGFFYVAVMRFLSATKLAERMSRQPRCANRRRGAPSSCFLELISDFPVKATRQRAKGPLPSQSKKCETTADRLRLHTNLDRQNRMPLGPIAGDRLHPDLSRGAFRI
jgi:hypothetical protein